MGNICCQASYEQPEGGDVFEIEIKPEILRNPNPRSLIFALDGKNE